MLNGEFGWFHLPICLRLILLLLSVTEMPGSFTSRQMSFIMNLFQFSPGAPGRADEEPHLTWRT